VTRVALPLADAPELGGLARRTAIVRYALALAIGALAVAAALSTRDMRVGSGSFFAPGSAGTIVLDLSSSTESSPPEQISLALRRIAVSGRKAGLVLFSDVAYEALPPEAKAVELKGFLRFFAVPHNVNPFFVPPPNQRGTNRANPWQSFRGGTRISAGLLLAKQLVERSPRKSVLLISDLNDSLFDVPQLSRVLQDYLRRGIKLRVVALNPNPDDRAFWERRLGQAAFVPDSALVAPATRHRQQLVADFPTRLVALGVLLALALAANELWGSRLTWRPAT
jgi:hypothetical protein